MSHGVLIVNGVDIGMKKGGLIFAGILIAIMLLKVLGDTYYHHIVEITSAPVSIYE
jgi:hypothetical protein